MKSSSTKIIKQKPRRFNRPESSDDNDDDVWSAEGARAEKVLNRRRVLRPTSNDKDGRANNQVQGEIMRKFSSTSDSEPSQKRHKNNGKDDKEEMLDFSDENLVYTPNGKNTFDNTLDQCSLFNPINNNLKEHRYVSQPDDDDQLKCSLMNLSNTSSKSKRSSFEADQFGGNSINEEIVDEYPSGSLENDSNYESFIINPNKRRNKRRVISDSSSESDVELTSSKKTVEIVSISIGNTPSVLQNKNNIDIMNLYDYIPKTAKISSPEPSNLNKNKFDVSKKNSMSSAMSAYRVSLELEKIRLEELIKHYTHNVNIIKVTIQVTNLRLLPDGGIKLKAVYFNDKELLEDTKTQFKCILEKLKHFPELTTYHQQQIMTLDVLNNLYKSLETCPSSITLSENPKGLKVELLPHQKYAVSWLMWREEQKCHGGVLADDVGSGKNLIMISLILNDSKKFYEKERECSSYDDSEDTSDTRGTLIICPSSLISQWQNEIKTKVQSGIIDAVQYYGSNRESSDKKLAMKDVVITSYNIVMWDQKNHQNTSPIFQIKWNRIILDKAHAIYNCKSKTSIAVCNIMAVNRWALSGTPVHNKEADFYALLKFIKCKPFDEWAIWKQWTRNDDEAGKNTLSLLVKTLVLRRTNTELSESLSINLPQKTFHTINVELYKEEREAYAKYLHFSSLFFSFYLYDKAKKENDVNFLQQKKFNDNIFKGCFELERLFKQFMNSKNIEAHILVLLVRLRQLCCHPCLIKNLLDAETQKVDGIQDTGDLCLVDSMSSMSIGIPSILMPTHSDSNPIFKDSWLSSKIKAVCDMVVQKVLHEEDKAVIVSQWPSVLVGIGNILSQCKVKTALFSRAVSISLRNTLVEDFNNPKRGPKVLLLPLTADSVSFNLVAANHLFLVDTHWNPQLEAQACNHIYKIGRKKPVNIYKFICTNTIETSIKSIQDHKATTVNNLFVDRNSTQNSKLTLEELKQIFQTT